MADEGSRTAYVTGRILVCNAPEVSTPPIYRGRLAPSPTGYLHLGHAATFWRAAERARQANGKLVLRIEDLDRERCKAEYESALIEDLHWAGLRWDEGPDIGGAHAPYRQTARMPLYLEAWRTLARVGAIYPCACTRRDVESALQAPHQGEPVYPGSCRPPGDREVKAREPGAINWRFRVPEGERIFFEDGCAGEQSFVAGCDFGDFVVWRKDGSPAYQLAVVVDDASMGITEVVRGADLLLSTAQQILVYRALGLGAPAFYHCPLVTDAAGMRLAKRAGSRSLRALRLAGAEVAGLRREVFPGAS